MSSKEHVIQAALKLPEIERLEIAELLYASVGPPDPRTEEEWDEELKRRIKADDSGQSKPIPWEEARKIMWGSSQPRQP